MSPKRQTAAYLLARGWTRRRRGPKEPWFYLDPHRRVIGGLRDSEALELQKKREASGALGERP